MDRATYLRPIAHRGLHDISRGIVENTQAAFEAAMDAGYGIECDVRPSADGTPFVFHDVTLRRLIDDDRRIDALHDGDVQTLSYRDAASARIMSLRELVELIDGRVPLFIEIKSEWTAPARDFLEKIAACTTPERSAIAVKSFDPAYVAPFRSLAPHVPRGMISGSYRGPTWWTDQISPARAARLRDCLEAGPVAPDFYSYHIDALPTPVMTFVRDVIGRPVITWTVRTPEQMALAERHADAIVFEGFRPEV